MTKKIFRISLSLSSGLFFLFIFQNCAQPFETLPQSSGFPENLIEGEVHAPQKLECSSNLLGQNEKTMRRLSKEELTNTLTDLFGENIVTSQEVRDALAKVPDQAVLSNASYDNTIRDIEGLYSVAQVIAEKIFADDSSALTYLNGCIRNNTPQCKSVLMTSFANKALRRPMDTTFQNNVGTLVDSIGGIAGLKAAFVRILTSPFFFMQVELGEAQSSDPSRIKLTQYEIASRLSYRLMGSMPDDELMAAAASSQLVSQEIIKKHAVRLLARSTARKHWRKFVADWLQTQRMTDPNPELAADFGISPAGLGVEAQTELLNFAEYIIFDQKGTLQDLYLSDKVFATTNRLAKIFQVPVSSQAQSNQSGFYGLIARPAKLISADVYTSPILRGVYIRKQILCQTLPSPDSSIVASRLQDLASVTHTKFSTRDIVTQVTSSNACIGCHSMINPVGFAMESFGPLGVPRNIERVYDDKGPTNITYPINTYVNNLYLGGQNHSVADARDLITRISESAEAKSCLTQKIMEATRYRSLDTADNCVVNNMNSLWVTNKPILDVITESVVNNSLYWKSAEGVTQ